MKLFSSMQLTNLVAMAVLMSTGCSSFADMQEDESLVSGGASLSWDSRYVSEGRDNLHGDSLFGSTIEAGVGDLTLGLWYADSPEQDYREFNAFATYAVEWRNFEVYLGYTHLQFLEEDEYDNEIGGGIAYSGLPLNLSIGLDATYSFEANGTFFEASVGGDYSAYSAVSLRPSLAVGFNAGYVPDAHEGANHFEMRLEAAIPFATNMELMMYLASTWAIDADPTRYPGDAGLKDFVYGGVALNISL